MSSTSAWWVRPVGRRRVVWVVLAVGNVEVVGPVRSVRGDVTGVDHEVGPGRGDVVDDSLPVAEGLRRALGQMRVGHDEHPCHRHGPNLWATPGNADGATGCSPDG